jgi:hypothetical protein
MLVAVAVVKVAARADVVLAALVLEAMVQKITIHHQELLMV